MSNKKLIMVIGIVVLLTIITFISIALYSNATTGELDHDSDDANDSDGDESDDDDSGGG